MHVNLFFSSLKNKKGFGLVQMLVAFGLVAILIMIVTSLMSNQNKEMGALDEKVYLNSLRSMISNVLSNPAYCGCFMGNRTFNYTTKVWNQFPNSMANSYNSTTCAAVGAPMLTVGTQIPGSKVRPTSISFVDINETTTGSGIFTAQFRLTFDQSLLTRSRNVIEIPMSFRTNTADPVAAQRLVTCQSTGVATPTPTPIDLSTLCPQIGGVYNASANPPCQPAYQ